MARYFLFVGGALLALLFVVTAIVPQEDVAALSTLSSPGFDRSLVRIRSTQKLPERVVYDTNLPTIVPAQVNAVAAATPPITSPGSRVRDTFAQFVPPEGKGDAKADAKTAPVVAEAKPAPKKRRIARARPPTHLQPMRMAQPGMFQPFRMAQQQQRGFFGGFGTW
ncbi:hypothetical protein AS156_27675 [Bradyrhizobium macuxiense]|uniref:Uncharacterized protein n=1 Tax=Bradyrhizobium macuxiense TaxID=1755647 RepID=A0A109K4R4_9BRAD|nr:hypothetical protein AS156_27675 [Bradyrhizobium macuxiense]